jgi:predicted nucleotidyltransferase
MGLAKYITVAGYEGPESDYIHLFEAGSALHGAREEGKSDLDIAGVFIESPERNLGVHKIEHFVTSTGSNENRNTAEDEDIQTHSLRHWAMKAIAGNPTLVAYLFAPTTLPGTVWNTIILPNTDAFIARKHINAFMGYASNQLHRTFGGKGRGKHGQRPELEAQFGYDSKAASHLIRLMYEGIELMNTGRLTFPRPEKDLLLEIRRGKWSIDRIKKHFTELEQQLKACELTSSLPKTIDQARISTIVKNAYVSHWGSHGLL